MSMLSSPFRNSIIAISLLTTTTFAQDQTSTAAPVQQQQAPLDQQQAPLDQQSAPGQQQMPLPSQAAPRPIPPTLTIPAGTYVNARLNELLSSERSMVGDAFTATLMQPIVVDGVVVAEKGQMVTGRVTEVKKAGRVSGTSRLAIQLVDLPIVNGQRPQIQSALLTVNGTTSQGRDAAAIAGTTAFGAAVGAAAAWGPGAAIGAGAGFVAATVGVLVTRGRPTILYPETQVNFRIEKAVTIYTDHGLEAFRYVQPSDYQQPANPRLARRPGPPGPPPPPPYYYRPYPYPYAYPYPYYYGPGPYWGPSFYFGYRRW